MNNSLIKKPSAWIPIVIPLTFFAVMLILFTINGLPSPQKDEGTMAHLFQIWIVLEIPMLSFFAIKWLPQAPKEASIILAIQIISALMVCAPVFIFKL